jgi:dTDP-4-dehydrorhamnose 3,5-epimerase
MKTFFNDVMVFTPEVFEDHRGFFFQSYDEKIAAHIEEEFVQDNHSYSNKNVIRGLHYQWDQPMGKLVRVVRGSAIDYFVDIRAESPTFGQYDSVVLSTKTHKMIWIPPGFAHGFLSLEDHTTVLYKCTSYYNKFGEAGINPFDLEINIDWAIDKEDAVISEKDTDSQSFLEYSKDIKFNLLEQK